MSYYVETIKFYKNMETRYRIIGKTNSWIASDGMRAYEFDSRTYKIEEYETN